MNRQQQKAMFAKMPRGYRRFEEGLSLPSARTVATREANAFHASDVIVSKSNRASSYDVNIREIPSRNGESTERGGDIEYKLKTRYRE